MNLHYKVWGTPNCFVQLECCFKELEIVKAEVNGWMDGCNATVDRRNKIKLKLFHHTYRCIIITI